MLQLLHLSWKASGTKTSQSSLSSLFTISTRRKGEDLPAGILDKSNIGQYLLADITAEALWMPAVVHSFNNTTNNELTCKKQHQNVKYHARQS